MTAPTQPELAATWRRLEGHLAGVDLQRRVPRSPDGLLPTDLAYLLWRRSPLDRGNALTALVVTPHLGGPVRFSYGLPLTETGEIDRDPIRWGPLGPPSWRDLLLSGEVPLRSAGRVWGNARFWLLPQPGFQFACAARRGPAGGAAARRPDRARPHRPAARGALRRFTVRTAPPSCRRGARRRRCRRPCAEAPRRTSSLRRARPGRWRGATGAAPPCSSCPCRARAPRSRRWARWRSPCCCWWRSPRAWWRCWRSPAPPSVTSCGGRCARTRSACCCSTAPCCCCRSPPSTCCCCRTSKSGCSPSSGRRARRRCARRSRCSASTSLSLEPGFGIETALDDELLVWLSRVLHHEVNLYWGSSRQRLEQARAVLRRRCCRERIPGDVYAAAGAARPRPRVAHQPRRRHRLPRALRAAAHPRRRRGQAAPLPVDAAARPAAGAAERACRAAASRRAGHRRHLPGAGRHRRAPGRAPSRGPSSSSSRARDASPAAPPASTSRPSEQELAALVAAIDEMARRIAEGRQRLVREKQVVERMVENVNSAVVSLDEGGRVLLANRLAGELLGVGRRRPAARDAGGAPRAGAGGGVPRRRRRRSR